MYDLLIHQAKIIDGTGKEAYIADLGIIGERIVKIGTLNHEESAGQIIQGHGLIVTPGFVDIHGHSDYTLLIDSQAESKIQQGITTEVVGNCGYSPAPIKKPLLQERKQEYENVFNISLDWQTFPEYLQRVENSSPSLNYVFLVGYNTVRASAMGFHNRKPSSNQTALMEKWIEEALDCGLFGLSIGLAYAPACFAQKGELIKIARLVARHGGILTSHIRNEGNDLITSLEEVLTIAQKADIPLQISHLKTEGRSNWWKVDQALEMIGSFRDKGVKVTCDRYPYLASQTSLQSLLPKWAQDGGTEAILNRLQDPATRQTIVRTMLTEFPEKDFWSTIYISLTASEQYKSYEGQNLAQLANFQKKSAIEIALDLLEKEKTQVDIILFSMSEENLNRILLYPWTMVASDSSSRSIKGPLRIGHPHPRSFGTFPRVIQKFCRQKKNLSLEEAVRKMTSLPCQKIGLKDRGIIKEGMFADLVLFDPQKISDQASYHSPFHYPSGIRLVVVNGQICVKDTIYVKSGQGKILYKK
ncbi:MAG: D-aminoacylase [Deltaproteobacteria bacterium]|nr:D-aminoacylase [Deltaproteobacteria bacterium]